MAGDSLADVAALDPGESFEEMCWGLLRRRYRPEQLVYLPATLDGDYGIEGFSKDGVAYQCYADRDSLTLRNRTEKQQQKLYRDTTKIKKYASDLEEVLEGLVIENYFLMVPQFDAASLVKYAAKRAQVVRGFGLSFISEDFAIHIKQPKDYPDELRAAEVDGSAKALIPEPSVESDEIDLFQDEKPDLVTTLESKLSALDATSDRDRLRDSFVRAFLVKEEVMGGLKEWPETWEAVERRRQLRQEKLDIENEIDAADPQQRVGTLMDGYQSDLIEHVGGLREPDAQRVAIGQVGDWLMRCPLRFRGQSS